MNGGGALDSQDTDDMIEPFIFGLSYGVLLFLIAAGLTLIFGMLGVINFAHGSFYMLGAYVTFSVVSYTGNFWLALVVGPLVVGSVGLVAEMLALRPLYNKNILYQVIVTFGLILIIEEAVNTIWGPTFQHVVTPPSLAGPVSFLGVVVPKYRLFIIVFGSAVALALYFLIEKTTIGMVIRASASNSQMVQCLGLDVAKVFSGVFAGGSALAALGGVVAAPVLTISPGMGFGIIIESFIVVVLGGLGSYRGAVVGALIIGEAHGFGVHYFPDTELFIIYLVMVVVLIVRPRGLFGEVGAHG